MHLEIDNDENNKKTGRTSKLGKIVREKSEDESKSDDQEAVAPEYLNQIFNQKKLGAKPGAGTINSFFQGVKAGAKRSPNEITGAPKP